MPVSLKALKAARKKVAIDFDGEVLNVEYCPANYTPSFADQLSAIGGSENFGVQIAETILMVLKGWDLLDEEGKKAVALETDVIRKDVPISIFKAIFEAIGEDNSPKKPIASD